MPTLTVTLKEELNLNGLERGNETVLTVDSIEQVINRVVRVTATEEDLLNIQASRPDAGSLQVDKLKYLRITNIETSGTVDLRFTATSAVEEYLVQLGAGESYVLFNNEMDVKRYTSGGSSELGDAVSFTNFDTLKAKGSTNIAVELFAACID
tara:strand:+ start:142 stop:600 length:459 start_codon:yes stop_codon:yes gene_type:complete